MVPPTLILAVISFRYISDPAHAVSATGVTLSTPEALTDTRVVGGITLSSSYRRVGNSFAAMPPDGACRPHCRNGLGPGGSAV